MRNVHPEAAASILVAIVGLTGCILGYCTTERGIYDGFLLKAAIVGFIVMLLYNVFRPGSYMRKTSVKDSKYRWPVPTKQYKSSAA